MIELPRNGSKRSNLLGIVKGLESKSSVVEMIMGNEFRNPKLPTAEEL